MEWTPTSSPRRVREAIEAKHPKLRYPAKSGDRLLSRLRPIKRLTVIQTAQRINSQLLTHAF
jgi:hypothetical protein